MSEHENRRIAAEAISALNAHDLDRHSALLHESCLLETELAPPAQGRKEVRRVFESILQGFPDLQLEVEQILVAGDQAITCWHATGTHKGEYAGAPATNRKVDIRGCTVVRIKDGLVEHATVYGQNAKLMQQIGILKAGKTMTAG